VNLYREYERKTSWPLDQESSKENLSVKEEFTQVNPCREYERKPLGQGRIHPSEFLSRVRKENLLAKKEFTQVNPCREYERKPLGQGRIHRSESLPRV